MRTRHKFRPSGQWILEDRIALSQAGLAAEIASAATQARPLRATFHGQFSTTLPKGIGGGDQATLIGTDSIPHIGNVKLVGQLGSNASLPPPFSGTQGNLVFTSTKHPGSLTLKVSGPSSDLAPRTPTTTHLTFTATSATGQFAPVAGIHGTATLTLKAKLPRSTGAPEVSPVHGKFTLVLTQA